MIAMTKLEIFTKFQLKNGRKSVINNNFYVFMKLRGGK